MAFPWLYQANFETGTNAQFDSETDGDSKLSFPHYSTLVRDAWREIPYRGAYAMAIDLRLGTADAYVQENDGFDLALAGTLSVRFYFLARALTMAASDRYTILTMQSAGPTDEIVVDVRNNAGTIEILAAETGASATVRSSPLIQDVWHSVELTVTLDNGVGNNGTIDFYLDGNQVSTQLGSLDQAAIIQARLGAIGIDAGTTAGRLLFDQVIVDNTRVFPFRRRFAQQVMLTQSGHVTVGPGRASSITLLSGGAADNELVLYDTDEANTNDASNIVVPILRNLNADIPASWKVEPYEGYFERGLYVALTGTNPRALVTLADGLMSPSAIASYAVRRAQHLVA